MFNSSSFLNLLPRSITSPSVTATYIHIAIHTNIVSLVSYLIILIPHQRRWVAELTGPILSPVKDTQKTSEAQWLMKLTRPILSSIKVRKSSEMQINAPKYIALEWFLPVSHCPPVVHSSQATLWLKSVRSMSPALDHMHFLKMNLVLTYLSRKIRPNPSSDSSVKTRNNTLHQANLINKQNKSPAMS